jgi:hypothetical protein
MTIVLELPAPALPHNHGLPPEVLARLLHKELTRLAAALDSIPDLEEAEAILIPAGTAYRLMALATAALKVMTATRPAGSR